MFSGSLESKLLAIFCNLLIRFVHAISTAFPLRSAVELAAVGEVFATLVVLVVSSFNLSAEIPKISWATCSILVFTLCPISTAPVLTPTLPSW